MLLKTRWVLVVMDQFTRRIIDFGVHTGDVDGVALCRMFNTAISTMDTPKYHSSDNDPLFQYHRWQADLSILDIDEVKCVPCTHPAHIHSLSDSSAPFAGNFWITLYSGMRLTCSESWHFSKITTIFRVHMRLSTVTRPLKSAVTESCNLLR